MRRVLEIALRHGLAFFLMLFLIPVVSFAVAYLWPRTYDATASLWALRRVAIIGATGTEQNLTATPADTQAAELNELLQTRAFALSVADESSLASTLSASVRSNRSTADDALIQLITKGVIVKAGGYNLFTITYSDPSPTVASQVVKAVVHQYGLQSVNFAVLEGQQQLQNDQTQLAQAQATLTTAINAEQQFISSHNIPSNQLGNNPQYAQLHAQTLQAQNTVQSYQSNITQIKAEIATMGTNTNGLYLTLDPPSIPVKPVSRLRALLIGGGAGIAVALLACAGYLVALMRKDQSAYDASDLEQVNLPPVLLQLPRFSRQESVRIMAASGSAATGRRNTNQSR